MSISPFRIDLSHQVATITLSRPEASNSLGATFWDRFPVEIEKISASPAVRVVVLTAEGKHFCSGIDKALLGTMVDPPVGESGRQRVRASHIVQIFQSAISCLANIRVPVIAAAQGACLGAGFDLFTACDLRYCTADAFFAIQEIQVGVAADIGVLQRLPRLIPDGIAREMAFTGRKVTAERAKAIGLVSEVFTSTDAMAKAVAEVAGEIATKSPLAVWGSKEMLNYNQGHTIEDSLRYAVMCGAAIFQPNDVHLGLNNHRGERPTFEDLMANPESFQDLA